MCRLLLTLNVPTDLFSGGGGLVLSPLPPFPLYNIINLHVYHSVSHHCWRRDHLPLSLFYAHISKRKCRKRFVSIQHCIFNLEQTNKSKQSKHLSKVAVNFNKHYICYWFWVTPMCFHFYTLLLNQDSKTRSWCKNM